LKHVLLLCLAAALALGACERRRSDPLPQDAYVWQRAWHAPVREAIARAERMQSLVVLAAQMSATKPEVVRPKIDFAALRATGKPIGLAIRMEPYFGPFQEDDTITRRLVEVARDCLAQARQSGVEPTELQLDFDCADAKLDGYRRWLRTLREAVAPLPVCPTVLPSWLDRGEFATLARESGRFVLQVHCVAPPRQLEDTRRLTDPKLAARWVEKAGRLHVPFRVALPTYTYLVAFDSLGKTLGVSAEGPSSTWPAGAQVVRWAADPAELGQLIAGWKRSRPAAMTGVIWYRLPVTGDAFNWRWPTLDAVMSGQEPRRNLRVEAAEGQPSEIVLINDGEQDEPLPPAIGASWEGARLVAADALAGYELVRADGDTSRVSFLRQPGNSFWLLPPGARRTIGWIRCENAVQIRIDPGDGAAAVPGGNARDGH
jgi:hypothetical protein